jgi:hypothetical protein
MGLFQALRARLRSHRPSGTEPFVGALNLPKISYLRASRVSGLFMALNFINESIEGLTPSCPGSFPEVASG